MGGGDDQAAAPKMGPHESCQAFLRRGVERGGWLVEQPDRPLDGDQPAIDSRRRCPADR